MEWAENQNSDYEWAQPQTELSPSIQCLTCAHNYHHVPRCASLLGDGRMSQTYHCATLYGYKTDSLIDRQQKRVQTHGHAYIGL